MNTAVRYYSKGGNTKKIAESIAKGAGVSAETIETPVTDAVDILFLGTAMYAFGVDDAFKQFVNELDSTKVKYVVIFSTTALFKSANGPIIKLLKAKNIPVSDSSFHIYGEFAKVHSGHPNTQDLQEAEAFAKEVIKKIE
jgi:flavodoxin